MHPLRLAALALAALAVPGCSMHLDMHVSPGTISASLGDMKPIAGTAVDKTVPAAGINRVEGSGQVGDVKVFTDGTGSITVKGGRRTANVLTPEQLKLVAQARVDINRSGDALTIKDVVPAEIGGSGGQNSPSITLDLEIHIPKSLGFRAEEEVGSISADGTFGAIHAKTGVGNVTITGQAADATAESGTGNVSLTGLRVTGRSVDAHSGTGDVSLALEAMPSSALSAHTGVGTVTVAVPAKAGAHVDMKTGVGNVSSTFPLPVPARGVGEVGGHISGDINGGGATVTLESGTGNVELKSGGL